jgi:uncharacterized UBP type Zn finger protein
VAFLAHGKDLKAQVHLRLLLPKKAQVTSPSNFIHIFSLEAKKKMEETANKQRRETLTNMGFPEWLIEQALQDTIGLEPAINWITQQLDGPRASNTTDDADSEGVMQLVAMGFDDEMARQALSKHRGNVEMAANWLFDKM